MDTKCILGLIEARKGEIFELLSTFIKINTENDRTDGNEKELTDLIHMMCLDMGIESDLYSPFSLASFEEHPDYLTGHNLDKKIQRRCTLQGH